MMKIIRHIVSIISIVIVSFIAISLALSFYYKDKLAGVLLTELNKNLKSKVSVSNVHFSLLSRFPNASIELRNVMIKSVNEFDKHNFKQINTDTLCYFKSLFLEFNIFDLINKNYTIRYLYATKGKLNILTDNKGNVNYNFWKTQKSNDTTTFKINLKGVRFNNVHLSYIHRPQKTLCLVLFKDLRFKGNLSTDVYDMAIQTESYVGIFSIDNISYLRKENLIIKTDLNVIKNQYKVKKGMLSVSGMNFFIEGVYTDALTSKIDITLNAKNLNIESFIGILPDNFKEKFSDVESKGNFYFGINIKGKLSKYENPHIYANFGVSDGELSRKGTNLRFTNLNLQGFFTNGKNNNTSSSFLQLKKFSTSILNSSISVEGTISNFKNPLIQIKTNSSIYANELNDFLKIDTIDYIKGKIVSNLDIRLNLNKINNISKDDFRNIVINGIIKTENLSFKLNDSKNTFSNITGKSYITNEEMLIDSLSFLYNDDLYKASGKINNLFNYLIKEKNDISIEGNLYCSEYNFEKFNRNTKSSEEQIGIPIPENIYLKANLVVDQMEIYKFKAKKVEADFILNPGTLTFNSVSFSSMDGKVIGFGNINRNADSTYRFSLSGNLDKINVTKLFYTFNSFGLQDLTDKNIKGSLSGNIQYISDFTKNLDIIPDSVKCQASISIVKGELIKFAPMLNLSKYIEVSELEHIRFNTLTNTVFIKNQLITIPEMTIQSNAFNITGYGIHYFNNNYEYHIQVSMSQLLSVKAKKAKKENSEFGIIEDDGVRTTLPLTIKGNLTTGEYKVSYDTKKTVEVIRENFKKEGKELKSILRNEFGWFKKDSTLKKDNDQKKKDYTIDFEENSNKTEDTKVNVGSKTNNSNSTNDEFSIKWEDE